MHNGIDYHLSDSEVERQMGSQDRIDLMYSMVTVVDNLLYT